MSAHALQSHVLPPKPKLGAATDLEKIPVDQVVAQLTAKRERGLSGAEAKRRLAQYDPNALKVGDQKFTPRHGSRFAPLQA